MAWTPSRFSEEVGGPLVANVPKVGPHRAVIEAKSTGPARPNRYSCRLECGHVSMTKSHRGMKPPRVVRCSDCVKA